MKPRTLRRTNIRGLTRESDPTIRNETIQKKYFMKNTIDHMSKLLEQHIISLPKGAMKVDSGYKTEDHDERFHPLKANLSKSNAFLIDLGASNHMVASKESFSSLQLNDGLSIHMGDDTQIQDEGKGSIKLIVWSIQDVLYVSSLATNLLYLYQMTHTAPRASCIWS